MDVSVRYHPPRLSAPTISASALPNIGSVSLNVAVEAVTGLKSAALAQISRHKCMEYYATMGVNLYAKLSLSFLSMEVSICSNVSLCQSSASKRDLFCWFLARINVRSSCLWLEPAMIGNLTKFLTIASPMLDPLSYLVTPKKTVDTQWPYYRPDQRPQT